MLHFHIFRLSQFKKFASKLIVWRFPTGFTLIEILVVVTLVGMLSAFVVNTAGGSQKRARDGVRKADFGQVSRAL